MAPIGNEQVFKAVVVVVTDSDGRSPSRSPQARLVRYIGERTIPIVLVKTICRAFRSCFESSPAQQKNIEPPIVVVIKKGATAPYCFYNVSLVVDRPVNQRGMQAGFCTDIGKAGVERQP